MTPLIRRARVAAAAGLAALLLGCGSDGPKIVKVSGTVTRNGAPVPGVAVSFTPANGRPSWGMADE
ncbi:MAG TPA: hypothetical protein VH092_34000, partial [Urbifossiella sp.]|nr:hypothetical protein [Urbifossiella sp.]